MKKIAALLAGAALALGASSALATPLSGELVRPVSINNITYPTENTLQQELDKMFGAGVVSAANDQLKTGIFSVSTFGSHVIAPQLRFEWTANAGTENVGMFGWNGNATTDAVIFTGASTPGDTATVTWAMDGSGNISDHGNIIVTNSQGTLVSTNSFTGIDRNFFGFFFQPAGDNGGKYYTVDSLNGGEARVLSYDPGTRNGGVLFAYEDGSDGDYNDAGFFVESVAPVPEPGTMMLLGAGFLGLAIYGKRRRNA